MITAHLIPCGKQRVWMAAPEVGQEKDILLLAVSV